MVTDLITMHSIAKKNVAFNPTLLLEGDLGRMKVSWKLIIIVNVFFIWLVATILDNIGVTNSESVKPTD